jgi:hypothetical protein
MPSFTKLPSACQHYTYADSLHPVSSIFGQECRKYVQKFIYTHKWNMTLCSDFHKNFSHCNKCIWESLPNFIQIWRKTCRMWYIFIDAVTWSVSFMTSISQSSLLNRITWRYRVPIFTQIIQERLKLRAYVKCDCHCTDFDEARAFDIVLF